MSGNDAHDGRDSEPWKTADGDLSARLQRLDEQLDRKRDAAPDPEAGPGRSVSTSGALGRAFRMSTEFIAGILAGGGLGWLFDRVLGTSPWGLIVLLMLGFAACVANLLRATNALSAASGPEATPRDH
jgi:ATP synthase protein I